MFSSSRLVRKTKKTLKFDVDSQETRSDFSFFTNFEIRYQKAIGNQLRCCQVGNEERKCF